LFTGSDCSPAVIAFVLAAGLGTRWEADGGEGHKLHAVLPDGRRVLEAAVDAPLLAGLSVIVISGASDVSFVEGRRGVIVVHNPQFAEGQATSVQAALQVAMARSDEQLLIGMGDQPWVAAETWAAVAHRLRTSGPPIVIPTIDGKRTQPIGLRRSVWPLLPTTGDAGGRILIGQAPELVEELACSGDLRSLIDIDTPGDLSSWS
jgi:molybdenum cofactor cytidylyltransferase